MSRTSKNKKLSYRRDSARCASVKLAPVTRYKSDYNYYNFGVDDAHTLYFVLRCRYNQVKAYAETAIQGHSRSSIVVLIDTAYMTSC